VHKPGSGGVRQKEGEVTNDEVVIIRFLELAGQSVVGEPELRLCFPEYLAIVVRAQNRGGNDALWMALLKTCGPNSLREGL
jgi:hypothetical protein